MKRRTFIQRTLATMAALIVPVAWVKKAKAEEPHSQKHYLRWFKKERFKSWKDYYRVYGSAEPGINRRGSFIGEFWCAWPVEGQAWEYIWTGEAWLPITREQQWEILHLPGALFGPGEGTTLTAQSIIDVVERAT